jgi:NADPH:quinone reductase-like Zn-dependent oxidoreductase
VIATQDEDFLARVKEITGGKGARVIFDPIAGKGVELLAQAAAYGGNNLRIRSTCARADTVSFVYCVEQSAVRSRIHDPGTVC